MTNSLKVMWGVLRYEFRMQIRRPALWLAFLCIAFLVGRSVVSQLQDLFFQQAHFSTLQFAADIAFLTNWLAPLGVGILLADRLTRDRRTRVDELLNTLPGTLKMRLLGKYLGTTLASLTPAFLLYLLIMGLAVWQTGNVLLLPWSLLCYVVIILPGMLFIAAFSVALPLVIWVPLYQFLFFGYWFWGNMLSPRVGIPTLNGTILTPIGSVIAASFFATGRFGEAQPAPIMTGVASLVALLGIALLVLVALYQFLKWEQARQ